jgi:hypothetical protein
MPPVHRRSRLLTREEMDLVNERSMSDDLMERAKGASDESPSDRAAPETLLQKAAGGPAAEDVRRGRFRR